MNNLLDTHVFIWFVNGESKLSAQAKSSIELHTSVNYLSVASLWEIAIKINLGKLELKTPFNNILQQVELNNFKLLPITFEDTVIVSSLPFHHRDPFDRLIISQCLNNNLTLISKDLFLKEYSVNLIW